MIVLECSRKPLIVKGEHIVLMCSDGFKNGCPIGQHELTENCIKEVI